MLRALFLLALLAACGGASAPPAMMPLPQPESSPARDRALAEFGRELYAALRVGEPTRLLLDDSGLHRVLQPDVATAVAARRNTIRSRLGVQAEDFLNLGSTEYAGLCIQGSRDEPADTVVGLRAPGWMFDRALVVARRPAGDRLASWLEGTFLYTSEGFEAIDLIRAEPPRWEHSDLELATCDMEVGLQGPLPVVEATP